MSLRRAVSRDAVRNRAGTTLLVQHCGRARRERNYCFDQGLRPLRDLRTFLAVRSASRRISDPEEAFAFAQEPIAGGAPIAPIQIKSEILALLDRLAALRPRRVVEIGTAGGGTLFLLTRVAADDARIVSVDIKGGEFGGGYTRRRKLLYRQFARAQQQLSLILGDSHARETRDAVARAAGGPIDFLLIDGDHRYEGVRADFDMYAPLVGPGGLIAVHDIVPGDAAVVGGVPRFWQEVRDSSAEEFVESWDQRGYGIGVLRRGKDRPTASV
jgi:predicted O-methyltransferase YrrM